MKSFFKHAALGTALFCSMSAFAASHQNYECPKLSSIQAEGVQLAYMFEDGQFAVSQISEYGFEDAQWMFVMAPISTDDEQEALTMGNSMLSKMQGEATPVAIEDSMACMYDTGNPDIYALAFNLYDMPDARSPAAAVRKFIH